MKRHGGLYAQQGSLTLFVMKATEQLILGWPCTCGKCSPLMSLSVLVQLARTEDFWVCFYGFYAVFE